MTHKFNIAILVELAHDERAHFGMLIPSSKSGSSCQAKLKVSTSRLAENIFCRLIVEHVIDKLWKWCKQMRYVQVRESTDLEGNAQVAPIRVCNFLP